MNDNKHSCISLEVLRSCSRQRETFMKHQRSIDQYQYQYMRIYIGIIPDVTMESMWSPLYIGNDN